MAKNRSSTETKAGIKLKVARTKEFMLFMTPPWNSPKIEFSRMEIDSLRIELSNVFCSHIRAELPAVKEQTKIF